MNKKGFTLMEMLAVIVMLGVLSVIVGLNIVNMNNKQNIKNYDQFVKTIENSGCTFVEMLSYKNDIVTVDNKSLETCHGVKCVISLSTLISYGFLNNDLLVYENNNGRYYSINETIETYKENNDSILWINKKNVEITWVDGLKRCELK